MDTDSADPSSSSRRDRSDRDRDPRDSRDSRREGGDDRDRKPFDPARKAMNREYAATEAAKKSRKECRVYVGNLAFGVKWNDLKDFMRDGGFYFIFTLIHHQRVGESRRG